MRRSRGYLRTFGLALGMAAIALLSGCGGCWAADWGGPGCHQGYGVHGHIEGGGEEGLILLGVIAVAWGVQEIVEAIRCR